VIQQVQSGGSSSSAPKRSAQYPKPEIVSVMRNDNISKAFVPNWGDEPDQVTRYPQQQAFVQQESGYPQPEQQEGIYPQLQQQESGYPQPQQASAPQQYLGGPVTIGSRVYAQPSARRGIHKPPTLRAEGAGHNFFDVGFNDSAHSVPRKPERLLPYVPRGPESVCKTYGHIFKLLNDPHASKHLPPGGKKKLAVHVSMPRLPAAGSAIAGGSNSFDTDYAAEDGIGAKMFSSKSSPALPSSGVQLPPLARSAPEAREATEPIRIPATALVGAGGYTP
jgi:hypothetical protein